MIFILVNDWWTNRCCNSSEARYYFNCSFSWKFSIVLKICNDQSFTHKYPSTVRKTCPYLVSNIPKLYYRQNDIWGSPLWKHFVMIWTNFVAMFVNKIKFFSALTGNKLFVSYQKCCSLIKRATSTSKWKTLQSYRLLMAYVMLLLEV